MPPQDCPQCGQPRASAMWRLCVCGHDFGEAPARVEELVKCEPIDPLRYDTFWRRAGALLIDGLIFGPVCFINSYQLEQFDNALVQILSATFQYEFYFLYNVFLLCRFGQTLGKMATRVKVFDVSETRLPTIREALLRDAGPLAINTAALGLFIYGVASGTKSEPGLDSMPMWLNFANIVWVFLDFITMKMNPKRRALHDFIAGTVVVRVLPPPLPRAGVAASSPATPVQ